MLTISFLKRAICPTYCNSIIVVRGSLIEFLKHDMILCNLNINRKQLRNAATRTFHDPNAIYSELILWRVDHIGPLSCTGGVSELARINSLHTSAFSNVAWLPTLVPSSVLGKHATYVFMLV